MICLLFLIEMADHKKWINESGQRKDVMKVVGRWRINQAQPGGPQPASRNNTYMMSKYKFWRENFEIFL